MSKQTNNINIAGTVFNLLDEGFDTNSSLKEITDNSIGAGAKRIKFFINLKTLTVYVMDDGAGMNKQQLTKLATLNDRKETSSAKQGKYGQGVKLAFAFLTQIKHSVTIISKTNNPGPEEDPINQIVIDFARSIETGNYEPKSERSSSLNEASFQKFTQLFGGLDTGTLIKIKMDKRLFKEFHRKIISTEISASGSILYEMGIINQEVIKYQNVSIEFHLQQILHDNEPEIVVHQAVSVEYTSEDDKSITSSEEQEVSEGECVSSTKVVDENTWDVDCSEEYERYHKTPSINLLDKSEEDQKHICYVLENIRGDKKFLLKRDGGFNEITAENLLNLAKKPKMLIGTIEEISARLNYKLKDAFVISLAYNEDWITALQSELIEIIGNIPSSRSSAYAQLLCHIKGHYYFRDNICSLNSRLKASHTQGGDRAQRKFLENIIAFIRYPSSLDREFGVTVKKFSSIEEIVDPGILTIIYYLKKRWSADYNKARKDALLQQKQAEEQAELQRQQQAALQRQQLAEQLALQQQQQALQANPPAPIILVVEEEDTETDTSSSEESESDISSLSSEEPVMESVAIEIEEPRQIPRSACITMAPIERDQLLLIMLQWLGKEVNMEQLEVVVNEMCKEYELYKPSVRDMVLEILTVQQKIQQLCVEIKVRYPSGKDAVLYGAEFYRKYKKYAE